jgi:hypothetical protein
MKATLILSTLTILSAISTASYAQEFPTTFGNSTAIISSETPAATDLSTSDRAYAPRKHSRNVHHRD